MADGTRTHDDQNHNLGLYQLSYGHHAFSDNKKYFYFNNLADYYVGDENLTAAQILAPFCKKLAHFWDECGIRNPHRYSSPGPFDS